MTEQEEQQQQQLAPVVAKITEEEEEEERKEREEREKKEMELKREFERERSVAIEILAQFQKKAPKQPLEEASIQGVVDYIKRKNVKNIIVMCGAGISVSAGIPDFRSKDTGLYNHLQSFNLDEPEDLFTLGYLLENPKPFFLFSKYLFTGNYTPTKAHYFIKLLNDNGLLLRCYTQNIDTLESEAGIPHDKTVFSHGSFTAAHCVKCKEEHDVSIVKEAIFADDIPMCPRCGDGIIKPDIVFFGESLPERFFKLSEEDFPKCDLLIVMGTSLTVHPFAGLVSKVRPDVPRVLINMEKVGERPNKHIDGLDDAFVGSFFTGFGFRSEGNLRDVFIQGKCDDGVQMLADAMGMGDELREMSKGCVVKDPTKSLTVATEAIAESVRKSVAEANSTKINFESDNYINE